jgi:hypothetical protein
MKTQQAFVGARVIDSLPFSQGGTAAQAAALKESGVDGVIGYLGAMTPPRLALVLAAGLAFMPVTFAGEYKDGAADEIAQLTKLGIPKGATVWLDLEGLDPWEMGKTPAGRAQLIALLRGWATAIANAGWMPGLYVGAPQPLTSKELYALPFVRYWWGLGKPIDSNGALVYPDCGWCMIQQWHGDPVKKGGMYWKDTGVFVDTNGVQMDHKNRLPVWVVASIPPEAETRPDLPCAA